MVADLAAIRSSRRDRQHSKLDSLCDLRPQAYRILTADRPMAKSTTVKGGKIKRDAKTGRFVEVTTGKGVSKASLKSQGAVWSASSKAQCCIETIGQSLATTTRLPLQTRSLPATRP